MPFYFSRPWYLRTAPAHIAIQMGVLGLILTVGTTVLIGKREYDRAASDARTRVYSEAYLLADHAGRLFEGAQVELQTAKALIADSSWEEIEKSEFLFRQLTSLADVLPYIQHVWLNDEKGRLRATSFAFPAPASDVSDRENFAAARQPGSPMFIGPMITGRVTGERTFLLSSRLEESSGRFRGMVSVGADLAYFAAYWREIDARQDTGVTLYRIDQLTGNLDLLAFYPAGAPQPDIGSKQKLEALQKGVTQTSTGEFVTVKQVGSYPVYLAVTLPQSVAMEVWWHWLAVYGPICAAALAGLGLLTALALRQARADDQIHRALLGANRELSAEIDARSEAESQLRQMQKIQAIGQLTGGIAHDFNNLLTVIIGNADVLVTDLADQPKSRGAAQMIVGAALRGAELTNRLLAFARRQPLDPHSVDVNALLRNLEGLLKQSIGGEVDLELVCAAGLWPAIVDPGQLETAIINLAINARDAMPGGGKITIETANASVDDIYALAHEEVSPGQYVLIAVTDTGVGMSPEVVQRAFEPFFTTKDSGRGSGLGLSMVYGFVKQSGGHIKIYSELGSGTAVKIYLPRSLERVMAQSARVAKADPLTGSERILLVEDDPDVRAFTAEVLGQLGYTVATASRADESLAMLDLGQVFDLLLTDVMLPDGMNGRRLADIAVRKLPGLKVLFISGYTENAIIHQGRLDPGVQLLSKPFRTLDLAWKVRKVLDG